MELVDFLLQRIAEDEWTAKRALELHLTARLADQSETVARRYGSQEPPDVPNAPDLLWWTAQDVVQWLGGYGPARIQAECEAKRRILDIDIDSGFHPANREILAAMVFPYRNHPDYDPAWAL